MRIFSDSQSGLSLIEAIIFILIISIGLSATISVYLFTTKNSANTMLSLKTVELSQALMDEILSKGYDELTPPGGGCVGSGVDTACNSSTAFSSFGIDPGETRSRFDDVDDYHDLAYCGQGVASADSSCSTACTALIDETETNIANNYRGYSVCIQVAYAGIEMNNVGGGTNIINVAANDAKRIDLIVTDPLDARMIFSAYRTNF